MNVNGRDIGDALDGLYEELHARVRDEADRELVVDSFDGDAFSNVRWADEDDEVNVEVHENLPTHAIAHALAIALQHVRQRLDAYPEVRRPRGRQAARGAGPVRTMLREVVMAPEAEEQIADLNLDREWEVEQRHAALKEILRAPPGEWTRDGTLGNQFASLQYARFEFEHPPEMWKSLSEEMERALPIAVARGKRIVEAVNEHGWGSRDACLQALLAARQAAGMQYLAWIINRETDETL
ncbi:MAG: hypothetical protein OXC56_06030 [Chloroflexi bacterium]|nr:hypothetical protein [Chloroflexota bacterium]